MNKSLKRQEVVATTTEVHKNIPRHDFGNAPGHGGGGGGGGKEQVTVKNISMENILIQFRSISPLYWKSSHNKETSLKYFVFILKFLITQLDFPFNS